MSAVPATAPCACSAPPSRSWPAVRRRRNAGAGVGEGKEKGKRKKPGCSRKTCPRGQQRNKHTCECECTRLPCSGGMEFDVDTCRCKCPRDMRECRDGRIARGACCPGDPPSPGDVKGCCHAPGLDTCTIDGCCRELDGMKACDDFCIDTNTHPAHRGRCGWTCDTPGFGCCNGSCMNLQHDEENRGACGVVCNPLSEACVQGRAARSAPSSNRRGRTPVMTASTTGAFPDDSTTCCRLSGRPHCC